MIIVCTTGWYVAVHSDRDPLDLLDRLVASWLHVADLETNRDGRVIILRANISCGNVALLQFR
jgi:hypothetical protein